MVAEAITAVRFKAEPHNLPKGHALAVEIGRGLFDGAFGRIYEVTTDEERSAFEYFARHHDKAGVPASELDAALASLRGLAASGSSDEIKGSATGPGRRPPAESLGT